MNQDQVKHFYFVTVFFFCLNNILLLHNLHMKATTIGQQLQSII